MVITAEWLAGFFDGEGCVHARWDKNQPRLPSIRVNITQSDKSILEAIGMQFEPSRIHQIHAPFGKRPCYQIEWDGRGAIEVLKFIQPFVRLKKIQVDAALEALSVTPSRGKRSSEDAAKRRTELAVIIKDANAHKQLDQVVN